MYSQSTKKMVFRFICLLLISFLLIPSSLTNSASGTNVSNDIILPPEMKLSTPDDPPMPALDNTRMDFPEELMRSEEKGGILIEEENRYLLELEQEHHEEFIRQDVESGLWSDTSSRPSSVNQEISMETPHLTASTQSDDVYCYGWPANISITLTIGQNSWTETSDSSGWVYFYLDEDGFDLVGGQLLSMSDGTTTITHTVFPIAVTTFDVDADTVSGTTWPNNVLEIYAYNNGWSEILTLYSDSIGNWTADFSGQFDIIPGTWGYAQQFDETGNRTEIGWRVPNPHLTAYPMYDEVSGYGWPADTSITLYIGQNSWIKTSNSSGDVYFYLDDYGFDLVGSQQLSMTDGVRTISHMVFPLAVTTIDENADTVSGTTWPSNVLKIYGYTDGYGSEILTIMADGDGNWVADFTGKLDIIPGTDGYVYQEDYDGNTTVVYWYLSDPHLVAYPSSDYVRGEDWPANTPITLYLGQNSWTETSNSSGTVYFWLSDYGFDLVGGHQLYMSDGVRTVIHTVFPLSVTTIDENADSVSGSTSASTEVEIYGCTSGSCSENITVIADTNGHWMADFSGKLDIIPGTYGWVFQYDDDGNWTEIYWYVPDPHLAAYPSSDYVRGEDWPANTPITLYLGQDSWTKTSNSDGYVYFYLYDYDFDLVGGHQLYMSDGVRTISHMVFPIAVTTIDENADTVSGTTWPSNVLKIYGYTDGSRSDILTIMADGNGNWVADFSGYLDLIPGSDGYVYQEDYDGNRTEVYWYIAKPYLTAYPVQDYVHSYNWPENTVITLTIGQNSWTETSNTSGIVYFYLYQESFDLQGGQQISLTDGTRIITYTVVPISITGINESTDTISGWNWPENELSISGYTDRTYSGNLYVTSDSTGFWLADFSGKLDVKPGTYGYARQYDDYGNRTSVYWNVPDPYLAAYPIDNRVTGYDWPANTPITLYIGQDSWTETSDSGGWVAFSLDAYNFDLLGGQQLYMSDGIRTIIHTVVPITIQLINQSADTVSGWNWPGNIFYIYGYGDSGYTEDLTITADSDGNWTADFSEILDIKSGTYGYAYQHDDNDNYTMVYWYVPDPRLSANLTDDLILGYGWPAKTNVTLEIGNNTWTETSDERGYVFFELESFDLTGNQVLTMQGGGFTITHTTFNLSFLNINQTLDYVHGRATPNHLVSVFVDSFGGQWSSSETTSDNQGYWTVYLSGTIDIGPGTYVGAAQYDNNGNESYITYEFPPLQVYLPLLNK